MEPAYLEAWTPTSASLGPLLCFASKFLVCWCSEESELAALGIDLGFLVMLGGLAVVFGVESVGLEAGAEAVRGVLVEVVVVHLLLECVFNGWLHPWINPKGATPMTWDMWAHHMGSCFAGMYCKVAGPW
eukprot:CAMPEP_0196592484 /NCGR_PEP_ID=MMETSP1081-20130531/72868_1 /TAXON_ID=36882 /ORGANISM="Pyramimonas amylifera, Strain CCMP720" /LENGTH=129 /DNA_ID=CAMNT_0041916199 /DNA_START=35 /DNA_END=421 /DNA_ORIENTATION=-